MTHFNLKIKNNVDILIVLILYLLIGIILINNYQFILSTDGISYISIAQKYLNGNFYDAVNGYWGPLLSWLIAIILPFSQNPYSTVYLINLVSLIIGFFTIIGTKLLMDNFEVEKTIKRLILLSLIPIILHFSFYVTTPDLLVTCAIIYYLYFLFNPTYPYSRYSGLMCGFTGVLAYLSKSFALPFFLAHFILFNVFFYFRNSNKEKRNRILKNLFIGLIVFFTISGVWIALISDKYGELTIGTTGEYNHDLFGPKSQGHYLDNIGLMKPPNESAVSAWEDPSNFKMESWSPFESWDYLKFQINTILKNIYKFINIIELFSITSILIIIVALALIVKSSTDNSSKNKLIYLIVTIILYSGGYSLIYIQERYIWLINILLLILGGYILSLLFDMKYLNKIQKNVLLIFLIASFVIIPISGLITDYNAESKFYIYDLSEKLKGNYNFHGNIASNDNYIESNIISFYTESKYYGKPKKTNNYNELKIELENNNIDYYMVWGDSDQNNYLSKDFKEITNGNIDNLRIYSLKSL